MMVVAPGFMGGGMDGARAQTAELLKRDALRGAIARGMLAEREGKNDAEEAALREGVAAAPDSLLGYIFLAESQVRHGKGDEAIATLDKYSERHPDDRWPLFHIGRISVGAAAHRCTSFLPTRRLMLYRAILPKPATVWGKSRSSAERSAQRETSIGWPRRSIRKWGVTLISAFSPAAESQMNLTVLFCRHYYYKLRSHSPAFMRRIM